MRRRLSLLLLLVAVLTACGRDEETAYDEAASRQCVRERGLQPTTRGLDFVARAALGGAFRTEVGGKKVVVVFGLGEDDAERTELAYRNFAPEGYRVQDVLRREKNVVMVWSLPPTDTQHDQIHGCLREAAAE